MAWCGCVLLLIFLIFNLVWTDSLKEYSDSVSEQCKEQCYTENQTDESGEDYISKCVQGCELWYRASLDSCDAVCNDNIDVLPQLYCVNGCNKSLRNYCSILEKQIGRPPAPALVPDTVTSSSLQLSWHGERLPNLNYSIQWRYKELSEKSPGDWNFCLNQSWGQNSTVEVKDLQPYTKYIFRMYIILPKYCEKKIGSPSSVLIYTKPFGPPTSPPSGLRVSSFDTHRISLKWESGRFTNGPILSYVLKISEIAKNGYVSFKDIPATVGNAYYMFQSLSPSTNYTVSVSMRNKFGEGPPATVNVKTLADPIAKPNLSITLILSSDDKVFRQVKEGYSEVENVVLYNSSVRIQGVGIDVSRNILFVSESKGKIFKIALSKNGTPKIIFDSSEELYKTLDLSVDWLNKHLYVLEEINHGKELKKWQIVRCDYDGRSQTIAYGGINSKPIHIEVDPYNGYLFWVLEGLTDGGLYRLDLTDISNGVKHDAIPTTILKDPKLGAFAIDHANFRILVPHLENNTMLSVSLNGQDVVDFRKNTQRLMFSSVKSLSFHNDLFYWTDGASLWFEEKLQNTFFQNSLYQKDIVGSLNSVIVAEPSSQPIPVAVNPPVDLQSVMGTNVAKINWQPPHLLGHQSKGAWQQWSYHLQITDLENTTIHKFIEKVTCTVTNLTANTVYTIKAAAVTSSGTGPWSSEFIAKTLSLSANGVNSSVLWSTHEGLLKTDLTGDNIEILIDKSQSNNNHIIEIAWFRDQLYLVTNSSTVIKYNTTSEESSRMRDMNNVGSLAVDWIGEKLYWASPKQQSITRSNLRGADREQIAIFAIGKELKIDSVGGFLYWNTGQAIECARLNGDNKVIYNPAEIFTQQVMGLTVDLSGKVLYWIIHGYEESNLYKAPTVDTVPLGTQTVYGELISSLSKSRVHGPLYYFSDRLIWLQNETHAYITDVNGKNKAKLNSSFMSNIHTIAVVDPSIETISDRNESINVIPEPMNEASFQIMGSFDIFNITWEHISKVNYGVVFYDVKVEYNKTLILNKTTSESYVLYDKKKEIIPPFSTLEVSIKPYTYWGAAPIIRLNLKSPQASPTTPLNPRVFVFHENNLNGEDNKITAIFRWNEPFLPNGDIKGYEIHCWFIKNGIENSTCSDEDIKTEHLQYVVKDVVPNATYYFQVNAFTDAGSSPVTETISADSSVEKPIPRLVVANRDSIKIVDLDVGSYQITSNLGKPVDFTVNIKEKLIYWLNEIKEIFVSRFDEVRGTRLLSLNGTGESIAIDWVSRVLYWSQSEDYLDQKIYTIYQLDLASKKMKKVLSRATKIYRLQVSPFTKSLYWIEGAIRSRGLFTAYYNGSNIRLVYNNHQTSNKIIRGSLTGHKQCSCQDNPSVSQSYSLDFSQWNHFKIYWNHYVYNRLIVSDLKGCNCDILLNATISNAHFPPHFMTVDNDNIYWSDFVHKQLYYMNKISREIKKAHLLNSPVDHKIFALGNKVQPYPPKECLTPKQGLLIPKLDHQSSDSLTLTLPDPIKESNCSEYDLAAPFYIIHYKPEADDVSSCKDNSCMHNCVHSFCTQNSCKSNFCKRITFDRKFFLNNLKPLTNYMFFIQIDNFYGNITNNKPGPPGQPFIFRTKAKAPEPVENLKAFVLSPNHALIEWYVPPPSGDDNYVDNEIWYEICWTAEGFLPDEKVKKSKNFARSNSSQPKLFQMTLKKLLPSQEYRIYIVTHSNNSDESVKSNEVSIKTYPEPNNITNNSNKPYEIHISWTPYKEIQISKFYVEYTELVSNDWIEVVQNGSQSLDGSIEYIIPNLTPKTFYKFRLKILYKNNTLPYYWPSDNRFLFETSADRPSPPGKPIILHVTPMLFQLQWIPSKPHGSPIIMYRMYGRKYSPNNTKQRNNRDVITFNSNQINDLTDAIISRSLREANNSQFQSDIPYSSIDENLITKPTDNEPVKDPWILLYNGTDNYWIVPANKLTERYIFKIQAENSLGWSEFSEESDMCDFSASPSMQMDTTAIILGILISVILLGSLLFLIYKLCFRKSDEKKSMEKVLTFNGRPGPDVELANLRELPRSRGGGGMFQHSTNILYNNGLCNPPTDAEIALLPHIRRDQISLTKFLGSGAFGEVYEGKATDLGSLGSETLVAVKTLRKGATDQEKTEFLQEAQLMSNFKHDHILSMLGVCLDNDPHYIIMELMEDGDLLSYLRARRPNFYKNHSLTLHDLLSMCMDVTKGCRYLEELHFVHRDLACRNCLVSQQGNGRIVKIGDFGLARDIYKNDYYRKEGEGLLPVRWMAVECLTDGVFSRASDVWAWAVLCWEVTALGLQPYSALPNQSVMRYVCGGGKLQRPTNCPINLFTLLQKCWSYNPDHRPTFKYCLEVLEELITHIDPEVPLVDEEPQYIPVITDGHINVGDPNPEIFRAHSTVQNTLVIQPPKYLELLYDGDSSAVCSDGYEVPRSSIRSNVSRRTIEAENIQPYEDNARITNAKISTYHISSDERGKVNALENIKCNGCTPNIIFGSVSENENEVNSLQKLISNSNNLDVLVRQNSIVSHSDDEKLSRNRSEPINKLMNGNGFVKNNSIINLNFTAENTSRTSC